MSGVDLPVPSCRYSRESGRDDYLGYHGGTGNPGNYIIITQVSSMKYTQLKLINEIYTRKLNEVISGEARKIHRYDYEITIHDI